MASYAVEAYACDAVLDTPSRAAEVRDILWRFRRTLITPEEAWNELLTGMKERAS
jgi:hypothetical protein